MKFAKFLEPALKRVALRALVRRRHNALQPPVDPLSIHRVLIFRPERFGDVLATLPLVSALKRRHPHWQIAMWTSAAGEQVCRGEPDFEEVDVIVASGWEAVRSKRDAAFDLAIDMVMHDSVNALLHTSRAVPNGLLVGWGKSALADWYDWAPKLSPSPRYNPHLALDIAEITGDSIDERPPVQLHFTREESVWADEALGDSLTAVINVSAGDPNREWQESCWMEVVRFLCAETRYQVKVSAFGVDRAMAARLCAFDPERVATLPSTDAFRKIACAVSRAAIFISPNTSLVHIAAGAGVPTVTLEPPAGPLFWSWIPPGTHVIAIPSSPAHGIGAIRPEQVTSAIGTLMGSRVLENAKA